MQGQRCFVQVDPNGASRIVAMDVQVLRPHEEQADLNGTKRAKAKTTPKIRKTMNGKLFPG
jgi:hypothetical protein